MMRKVSEAELAREPARPLAEVHDRSADVLAVEVLEHFLRAELELEPVQRRALTRRLWSRLVAYRGAK